MMVSFQSLQYNLDWKVINVYGPIPTPTKRELWHVISRKLNLEKGEKIINGGDFNATLNSSEKSGGLTGPNRIQQDLWDFVDCNHLREVVSSNGKYTWTNRLQGYTCIAKKLDRFLLYGDWSLDPSLVESSILPFSGFDHYPIQLDFASNSYTRGLPFRFEKMWIKDETLYESLL